MSDRSDNGAPLGAPETGASDASWERLDELLADRAVFGLDEADAAELDRLLGAIDPREADAYELAAAQVAVATAEAAEPLPKLLRERLLDDAADYDFETKATPSALRPDAVEPGPRGRGGAASQWPLYTMTAVAAGLLLSFYLGSPDGSLNIGVPTLEKSREMLVAQADDLVRVAWAAQDDPAIDKGVADAGEGEGAYGEVVWSDARQEGYMTFRGLRANDPSVEQYQLWVFDEARDAARPVDGGVFDIEADTLQASATPGEIVVPIDAKLRVTRATLFAVTVEKPGGVVVSDRSRLPLLAQL